MNFILRSVLLCFHANKCMFLVALGSCLAAAVCSGNRYASSTQACIVDVPPKLNVVCTSMLIVAHTLGPSPTNARTSASLIRASLVSRQTLTREFTWVDGQPQSPVWSCCEVRKSRYRNDTFVRLGRSPAISQAAVGLIGQGQTSN